MKFVAESPALSNPQNDVGAFSHSSSVPLPEMKISSSPQSHKTQGTLHVRVQSAEDLKGVGSGATANAFVHCYLLPLGGKRKTKPIENTLDPVWDEEFLYKAVYYDGLRTERALELTVWDKDRLGTNSFMGCIRLGPNPLTVDHPQEAEWMDSSGEEVTHWEEMLASPGEWVEHWHALRPSMEPLQSGLTGVGQKVHKEFQV